MSIFRRKASSSEASPAAAPPLTGTNKVIVVGTEYHEGIRRVREGDVPGVTVEPDPNNKHDKNAVLVRVQGVPTGYLSAARAKSYRPQIDRAYAVAANAERGAAGLDLFVMLPALPRK